MVRITDPALKPAGWDSHAVAPLHQWTDISVYELHVRDFSATDSSVPEALRGECASSWCCIARAQQASVMAIAHRDAFNWGYDPVHWSVPEGSYATDPDGPVRITEFRTMVMALHAAGWHVIVDVVYNHVYASGPHNKYSVLDKIVPGYYQRRMEDGEVGFGV
ncbi:hypothetical protein FOA52_006170 [Chlamydomonas sp. UWO 241]|nr:hypothetical protein FOA52_006170 [Chlamydomonas sp. UWO 241]